MIMLSNKLIVKTRHGQSVIHDDKLPSYVKIAYDQDNNEWCYFEGDFYQKREGEKFWKRAKETQLSKDRIKALASLFN